MLFQFRPMLFCLSMLTGISACSLARAQAALDELADRTPKKLLDSGVSQIGNLKIDSLLMRNNHVQFLDVSDVVTAVGDGTRESGQFIIHAYPSLPYYTDLEYGTRPGIVRIAYSRAASLYSEKSIAAFLLHETLSASWTNDLNYQRSAYLTALAENLNGPKLLHPNTLKTVFESEIDPERATGSGNIILRPRGGTVVGGGGEVFPFLVKVWLYEHLHEKTSALNREQAEALELRAVSLDLELSEAFFVPSLAGWIRFDERMVLISRRYVEDPALTLAEREALVAKTGAILLEQLDYPPTNR